MKVWNGLNKFENIEIGDKVFVGRCGSGICVFGEYATLIRTTKTNLVFETESGAIVKTHIDNLNTIGKAAKANYWVSLTVNKKAIIIKEGVFYWNKQKGCAEYK